MTGFMMSSNLKEALKSICSRNGWSYAVFWRFDHRNPMLLIIEDAYYEQQMGPMINKMLLQVHLLGEGVVGNVASTGKHQWILSDVNNFGNEDVLLDDSQLHELFSCGLKTIAVICVQSRGVVQLGSHKKILENDEFLDETKRSFGELAKIKSSPSNKESYGFTDLSTSFCSTSITPMQGGGYDEPVEPTCAPIDLRHPMNWFASDFQQEMTNVSNLFDVTPSIVAEDELAEREDRPFPFPEELKPSDCSSDLLNSYTMDNLFELIDSSQEQSINGVDSIRDENPACSMDISGASLQIGENDLFEGLGLEYIREQNPNEMQEGLFSKEELEEILGDMNNSEFATESTIDAELSNKKRRRLESHCVSTIDGLEKSRLGSWVDDRGGINDGSILEKSNKMEDQIKKKKKRDSSEENKRVRPKDRQKIQDRIQELRGIIPKSHKCSIDFLLHLTVKHILFLQSVIQFADKLKHLNAPKMVGLENDMGVERNMNGMNAIWELDLRQQLAVCPVVVEDITSLGLVLVEILCEDQGFFLEIADVIKGFGLNILKGLMELREHKVWARFIIEASSKVTRIDVIWSLVQLLEQASPRTTNSTDRPGNGSDNLMNTCQQSSFQLPVGL